MFLYIKTVINDKKTIVYEKLRHGAVFVVYYMVDFFRIKIGSTSYC